MLCCITQLDGSFNGCPAPSDCDIEDVERRMYKSDLVFYLRLAREAMPSVHQSHPFKALYRSGRCPHHLHISCGTDDSLECAMIGFNDLARVFACSMFCVR